MLVRSSIGFMASKIDGENTYLVFENSDAFLKIRFHGRKESFPSFYKVIYC